MTAETIANQIIRLQRRRLVMQQIHQDGKLTRRTIAALWRTTQHADNNRLIRWAIDEIHQPPTP